MQPTFKSRDSLQHPRLMIPGPVDVQDSILSVLSKPVMPHYGAQWTALYTETTEALKAVFHTQGEVFLLVGSGSAGLDAAVSSLFVPGEKVLITNNGFFGERIAEIARARGLEVVEAAAEWGKPVEAGIVEAALSADREIRGIIAIHHETSTGVLNPVREIGALARKFGVPLLVDAVSSLGGERLEMDEWGVDVCVTASNKCLESVPGVSPVAVGANAWKVMQAKHSDSPGWYLNLQLWKKYLQEWGSWHPAPVTMATNTVVALNAALEALFTEGLETRLRRYRETAAYFRAGVRSLGFDLFVDGETACACVSSMRRLPGMDVPGFITHLLQEKQIQIAGGLGRVKGSIFRVGHMGKAGSQAYVVLFLEATRDYLQHHLPKG
jgi:alanine-glyoxylate transaminase/serine-glyoxylate transaminase/serine-pyruvate transaminase